MENPGKKKKTIRRKKVCFKLPQKKRLHQVPTHTHKVHYWTFSR